MSPEMVVFYYTAPMRVDHSFAVFFWTDTIFPVIFIGEATTRPAKHRNFNLLKRLYNIVSNPIRIRNRRIFAYPYSFINAPPQMLGEMTINIAVNNTFTEISVKYNTICHKNSRLP
ncbi:hypothetical protein D3C77_670490 [compost metagenome]